MRKTCGTILLLGTVVVTIVAVAPSAFAKGPLAPTTLSVTITGPGLSRPITSTWKGSCFGLDPGMCSNESFTKIDTAAASGKLGDASGDVWTIASATGLTTMANGNNANAFAPAQGAKLGPKYSVVFTMSMTAVHTSVGSQPAASGTITMDLYPWAPKPFGLKGTEPWTYTHPGQSLFGGQVGSSSGAWPETGHGWWPSDELFFGYLVANGLPATNPSPAPPANQPPANVPPAHAPPASVGWPFWLGIGLLVALVGAGAAAGRRVASRRALPPPATA